MNKPRKRVPVWKKILVALIILILLTGIAFQIFITRYLPPIVKQRLSDIIVKGSDSLYRFEVGKFDVSFWGGSVRVSGLHITIDSTRYKIMADQKKLPPLTFNLHLGKGNVEGINIRQLIFSKRISIELLDLDEADITLARHFRTSEKIDTAGGEPLWKLIRPDIRSIHINAARCASVNVTYQNVDSARDFRWKFDKCNAIFDDIRVDSISAADNNRLLFSKDVALSARNIKMKTPGGLYNLQAGDVLYSSAARRMELKEFVFRPAISHREFKRHFGYQQQIYKLRMPVITMKNFLLPQWISYNKLIIDTIELASPEISVNMDRNAPPNPYSKKGQYPNQLIQRAPFTIAVKRLKAWDATVVYTETNDKNGLTGKVVFPAVRGYIDNITNDMIALSKSNICVADVHSGVMKTGNLHAVFRFNLEDKAGAFNVNATISNLDAPQLQPIFKAMTSTDLQSFNMRRLDYVISGNENVGRGTLKMKYDEMDILLNRVESDKSLNKRGFLSFLANRLVIYKENPMKDEEERTANNVVVARDATRSFFNLVWKTLYSSAGKIVLRPVVQRKMEKRRERQKERAKEEAGEKKK
jgi:hypothetical protein